MWIELKDESFLVSQATKKGFLECEYGSAIDISYPTSDTRRGRVQGGWNMPNFDERTKYRGDPKVVGGIGEKKSNNGTQWYQQDRVYQGDIAMAHPANLPGGGYKYLMTEMDEMNQPKIRIRKLTPR